jgi:energy-coupling factor transport system ATP-binding protein
MSNELLSVQDLHVEFKNVSHQTLDGLSFELASGNSIGIIGNNGSGKSTLAQSLLGIIPNLYPAKTSGTISSLGQNIGSLPISKRLDFLGYSFQNVDAQVLFGKAFQILGMEEKSTNLEIVQLGIEILKLQPILNKLPSEISGGEAQKLALVTALRRAPRAIIYDEATTALDPVIRKQFGLLVQELQTRGHGLILIAQSVNAIERYTNKNLYLNQGKLTTELECSTTTEKNSDDWLPTLFTHAPLSHNFSRLQVSKAQINRNAPVSNDGVSVDIKNGEVIAIIGANGCGKSTLIQKIAQYLKSSNDEITFFDGNNHRIKNEDMSIGLLFQNPSYQLIESSIEEHLLSHFSDALYPQHPQILIEIQKYFPFLVMELDPLQLSYGQQKILSLVSLIISGKHLILLDEPEQGLDSNHIQFLQYWFQENKKSKKQTIIYITHDMELASNSSDRVIMLKSGSIFKIFDNVTSTQLEESFEYIYSN